MKRVLKKWGLPLGILFAGLAVAAGMMVTAPRPEAAENVDTRRLVRTFRAEPTRHRIAIRAYGTSRAADEWLAATEVAGTVELVAESFAEGELIAEGTTLVRIDKTDYELAFQSAQNEVASREQQLLELEQNQQNVQRIIDLRRQQLAFAKSELDRYEGLVSSGAGAQAEYERASSNYVDRQAQVNDLQNQLNLFPVQQRQLELSVQAAKLRQEQAQRDIDRCEIKAPFTALCISRNIELHQTVGVGQQIGHLLGLEKAEVVAMVEPRRALQLFPRLGRAIEPIDLRMRTASLVAEIQRRFESAEAPVDITWRAGEGQAQWRGRLVRASATIDSQTRSIPLIVEVDDAFSAVQLGVKPAMVPGMFVEVLIYGDRLEDVFVVPRDVVRDDHAYVVRQGVLAIVPVDILVLEDEVAVIESGLIEGDQVVLADLFPAANGMKLATQSIPNPVSPRWDLPELQP